LNRFGLLWDVAEGLHYLHLCDVIHGDLKGANILIDEDGHARLTDFGLTSIILGDKSVLSFQDAHPTPATTWQAPEISQGGVVTKEGDVFTFAMVAVETFTEHPTAIQCYAAAVSTGGCPQRPATFNDDLWGLMQACWNRDPWKRPTTFELVDFFRPSFSRELGTLEMQTPSTPPPDEIFASPEGGNSGSHSGSSAVGPGVGSDGFLNPESPGTSRLKGRGMGIFGKRTTPTTEHGSPAPADRPGVTIPRRRLTGKPGSGSS